MKFTLTEQQRPLLIGLSNPSYTDPSFSTNNKCSG